MKRREFLTASALASALPAVPFALAGVRPAAPAATPGHFALGYLEGSETDSVEAAQSSWRDALSRRAAQRRTGDALAIVRVLGLQASRGQWPELDALSVQARFSDAEGNPAQFLLWQMQRSGQASISSPARFSARLDSLRGFALNYRLMAAGGARCIPGDSYCAMTDLFSPLLREGLYALVGPREGASLPPPWSALAYSGVRQRPLLYRDGRANDFDALVLSVSVA